MQEDERLPEIFVRGKGLYSANLSASSPVGTVQSIEHTLRSLDKMAAEQRDRVANFEKELTDYQAQSGRPFEHERRLQELLKRQAELVQLLDLDKSDQQAVQPDAEAAGERETQSVAARAKAFMRDSGTAIRDMAITQRTPPTSGSISGRAVAKEGGASRSPRRPTASLSFRLNGAAADIEVGEKITIKMHDGLAMIDANVAERSR